jgi:hypothetical protein
VSVSLQVRIDACERDGVFDPTGYDPQHCFFKSEYYGSDRDELWNIAPIRRFVHDCVHHPSTDEMVEIGQRTDIEFKEKALERYTGPNKEKLQQILDKKRKHYGL